MNPKVDKKSVAAAAQTSAMVQTFGGRIEYTGFGECASWCWLEIWEAPGRPPVVIVTNPLEDNGTSVTNMAEGLAALVCRRFRLEPRTLIWIECYEWTPADEAFGAYEVSKCSGRRNFDRVYFEIDAAGTLSNPTWMRFGLAATEVLVGHPL